jgi:hypothetical protein
VSNLDAYVKYYWRNCSLRNPQQLTIIRAGLLGIYTEWRVVSRVWMKCSCSTSQYKIPGNIRHGRFSLHSRHSAERLAGASLLSFNVGICTCLFIINTSNVPMWPIASPSLSNRRTPNESLWSNMNVFSVCEQPSVYRFFFDQQLPVTADVVKLWFTYLEDIHS